MAKAPRPPAKRTAADRAILLRRLEDELRIQVQSVKLMEEYRREWDATVAGREVTDRAAAKRRPSPYGPRADALLAEALGELAGRHFLPGGAVDPRDAGDFGLYGSFARRGPLMLATLLVAGLGPRMPGREKYVTVTVDPHSSVGQIEAQLREVGALKGVSPARDAWGGDWGLERAFEALILYRNGLRHDQTMQKLGLDPHDESSRRQYFAMLRPAKRRAEIVAQRVREQQGLLAAARRKLPDIPTGGTDGLSRLREDEWLAYGLYLRANPRL